MKFVKKKKKRYVVEEKGRMDRYVIEIKKH